MTKLRVAIQMNHPRDLNPHGDSTLLLGREAQKRGHELWFYPPEKLTLLNGAITAHAQPITLHNDTHHYYDLGEATRVNLADMHVVLLRQDPPFNIAYLSTTYLLELLPKTTLVVNNPASVRNNPEKIMPLAWPQFMPPTLISSDLYEIEAFRKEQRDIIIKPVYGHGGRAILRVKDDDSNLATIIEMHLAHSKEPLMIQRFLPEVKSEDRRIILINGEVAGIMGRIPGENEIRANFRVGGSPAKATLTARQQEICEAIKPTLKEKGLLFVGLDTIGDWLTEINITSPAGLVRMNELYGKTLEAELWNAIEDKLQN